jgi:hypothetical protein
LGKALSDFLEEFRFTTAGFIVQHFGQSKHTIKEILQWELGPWRFSRRLMPHSLSEAQKADRTAMANDLLSVLHSQVDYSFSRTVTEDEFWFLYRPPFDYMFSASRDEVIPREKATIGSQKVILAIFFGGMSLIISNPLPSGARFNQKCFIHDVIPDIVEVRRQIFHRFHQREFSCTWSIPCVTMVAR